MASQTFKFRPRYRALALVAVATGGVLDAVTIALLGAATLPLVTGAAGLVLGAAYLVSPTWRMSVVVDDEALEVRTPTATRFRLPWGDVVSVVASPTTKTCYVDGGAPEKSLLVPGLGAPAPYDLQDRDALFDAILAHVDPAKVKTVESLDKAKRE